MGQISLAILIVLLVSGTFATPRSSIKQDHPDEYPQADSYSDEKGQRDLSDAIPNDQDDQNVKRKVSGGTIIDGIQLTFEILKQVLDTLGSINRKIAIGVDNESGSTWRALNTYFNSGTSDNTLPYTVNTGQALLYGARKTSGPVATGCVGVVAYYIPDHDITLYVMFSVPFDYNWYSNWWNVKIYDGEKRATSSTFDDLYYSSNPFKGDDGWHHGISLGHGLTMSGSMTSSGQASLAIFVSKA